MRGLLLVALAVAWMTGIWLSWSVPWIILPPFALLSGAVIALVFAVLLRHNRTGMLISLTSLCLLLGAWRYTTVSPVGDAQAIRAFIGTSKLEVRGNVADEPKLQVRSRLLIVAVSSVSTNSGSSWQDAHGQLAVEILGTTLDNPYGPNYGDNVELQGKVQAPPPHSPPGIFASMAFPRISVGQAGGFPFIAAIYQLRTRLAGIIAQALPQPLAAELIAILLSLRTPALRQLTYAFNVTGTAHLIAASGFKVTILAGLVASSPKWLYKKPGKSVEPLLPAQKRKGKWLRWLASALTIVIIIVYTFLSGAGPAALRAGIMGILLVVAPRFGRIYNIYTALALAALLMSLHNPFVLWDTGFQLSFLGTLGIVVLTPLFLRPLHFMELLPLGHYNSEIIAVTLAAQVATWPIIAIAFKQISFIAIVTNVLTVPLLGALILLGALVCGTGLFFLPVAMLFGWAVRPLLEYLIYIVRGCASLRAYWIVPNVNSDFAWGYYALLIFVVMLALRRWPSLLKKELLSVSRPSFLFPGQIWRLMQLGAAVLVILATGAMALATQPDGRLTITFLCVGPAGQTAQEQAAQEQAAQEQAAQGEAILLHTPDGKTVLIDGGLDASSLAQELDGQLPIWQRSLDAVILTTPRQDHLTGLQDIVSRYQIGEVLDAGMLHPNVAYALWRRTISERHLNYSQVRQGATLPLGTQVTLQILWPPSPLHKGTNEELDNALIVRLVAPGFHMLLLGAAALSKYALEGLLSNVDHSLLQADIVQLVGQVGKSFPSQLSAVLQLAHPSLLVITPAALTAKQRKAGVTSSLVSLTPSLEGTWEVAQTAQVGTLEISSNGNGWNMNTNNMNGNNCST